MKKVNNSDKEFRLKIVEELSSLHDKIGYKSEEIDEDIIQSIWDPEISNKELENIRNNMWLGYIRVLLENIDFLIIELLKNFAEVEELKNFNKKFMDLKSKYETNNSNFKEIRIIFDGLIALYDEIINEEKILKRKGRERFLLKIYPVYATIFSTIYGGSFYAVSNNLGLNTRELLFLGIGGWIIILFTCYFFTKYLFRRGLRQEKIEK